MRFWIVAFKSNKTFPRSLDVTFSSGEFESRVLRYSFSIDDPRLVHAIPRSHARSKPRQKFLVTMDLTPAKEGVSALITTCGHRNSAENL